MGLLQAGSRGREESRCLWPAHLSLSWGSWAEGGEGPELSLAGPVSRSWLSLRLVGLCLRERKDTLSLLGCFNGSKKLPPVDFTCGSSDEASASRSVSPQPSLLFLSCPRHWHLCSLCRRKCSPLRVIPSATSLLVFQAYMRHPPSSQTNNSPQRGVCVCVY